MLFKIWTAALFVCAFFVVTICDGCSSLNLPKPKAIPQVAGNVYTISSDKRLLGSIDPSQLVKAREYEADQWNNLRSPSGFASNPEESVGRAMLGINPYASNLLSNKKESKIPPLKVRVLKAVLDSVGEPIVQVSILNPEPYNLAGEKYWITLADLDKVGVRISSSYFEVHK